MQVPCRAAPKRSRPQFEPVWPRCNFPAIRCIAPPLRRRIPVVLCSHRPGPLSTTSMETAAPGTDRVTRSRARTLASTGATRECGAHCRAAACGAASCQQLPLHAMRQLKIPIRAPFPAARPPLAASLAAGLPDKTPATRTTRRRAAPAADAAAAAAEPSVAPAVLFDMTNDQASTRQHLYGLPRRAGSSRGGSRGRFAVHPAERGPCLSCRSPPAPRRRPPRPPPWPPAPPPPAWACPACCP